MADSTGNDHDTQERGEKGTVSSLTSKGRTVVKFVLAQWLVIGFGLSCLLGYLFPSKIL
jgi:hypothetical protein